MPDSGRLSTTSALSVLDRGNLVEVIGRGTKVKFVLDQSAPAESLESELRTYLSSTRGWFAGGEVEVDTGERVLRFSDLQRLRAIFEDEYNVNVADFDCKIGLLQDSISEEHSCSASFIPQEPPEVKPAPIGPGIPQEPPEVKPTPIGTGDTLFVKANCRSGTEVKHSGDVVMFGNVNPGGKVIADGDVVVLGSLRGTVQAGAKDAEDSNASIIALELGTARLQIGTRLYQHTLGKGKNREVPLPVIACVRGGGVEVMPFAGSFHRGKERKPQWQERRM